MKGIFIATICLFGLTACATEPMTPEQRAAVLQYMQIQNNQQQQRQNLWQEQQTLAASAAAARANQPVNCWTNVIGNQAFTSCQ
jgi:hypothetical protein